MTSPTPSAALRNSDLVRKGRIMGPIDVQRSRRHGLWTRPIDRIEPYDPGRAANNIARLKRLEADYESGHRADRQREHVDTDRSFDLTEHEE